MKPPVFEYHRPDSIPQAIALLSTLENARFLAGGQSLIPMLNMRFAFPDHLIDLNRVSVLAGITLQDNEIRIGAMTRQRDLLTHPIIQTYLPLLAEALTQVGHRQTRNRGTIGGSLCHLDPAAELACVAVGLDAVIDIEGPAGKRSLAMPEFALGFMTTALSPDEMLTAIRIPMAAPHGHCFTEFSRRHGDFAIVSAGATLRLAQGGHIEAASLTLGGVGAIPVRMRNIEAGLRGITPSAAIFAEAASACAEIDAMEDAQIPAWYRRRLAVVLARRALQAAHIRATGKPA